VIDSGGSEGSSPTGRGSVRLSPPSRHKGIDWRACHATPGARRCVSPKELCFGLFPTFAPTR